MDASTTTGVLVRHGEHPEERVGRRSRTRSRTCRSSCSREATATMPLGDGQDDDRVDSRWCRRRTASGGTTGASACCCRATSRAPSMRSSKVTEAEPEYADGWLNVARALIQEGETEAAKPFIEKALKRDASLGRIHFFKALIEKADGDYAAALASLADGRPEVPARPRGAEPDRAHPVPEREYAEALKAISSRWLGVDPEDLQMHYTAMLALARHWQRGRGRARGESSSSGSRRRNRRRRSPARGACSARKTTTSGSRFTSTRRCRWGRRGPSGRPRPYRQAEGRGERRWEPLIDDTPHLDLDPLRRRLPWRAVFAVTVAAAPGGITFTDVTTAAGITFTHNSGRAGQEVPARDARLGRRVLRRRRRRLARHPPRQQQGLDAARAQVAAARSTATPGTAPSRTSPPGAGSTSRCTASASPSATTTTTAATTSTSPRSRAIACSTTRATASSAT